MRVWNSLSNQSYFFQHSAQIVGQAIVNCFQNAKKSMGLETHQFFLQVEKEPGFQNFQNSCSNLKQTLREIKQKIEQGGVDPQQLKKTLLNHQKLLQKSLFSSFYYHQQLTQLSEKLEENQKIPNVFVNVLGAVNANLIEELKKVPLLSKQYFYNDLINYVIQFSGNQITVKELQDLLDYYSKLVDANLHQKIQQLITEWMHQAETVHQAQKDDIYLHLPDSVIQSVLQRLNEVFKNFDEYNSDNLIQQESQPIQYNEVIQRSSPSIFSMATLAVLGYLYYYTSDTNKDYFYSSGNYFETSLTQASCFFTTMAASYGTNSLIGQTTFAPQLAMWISLSTLSQPVYADTAFQMKRMSSEDKFMVTVGGPNDDHGFTIQERGDGNIFVAGPTNSYGAGVNDAFLTQFTSNGTLTWSATLGGSSPESANAIYSTSDGGMLFTASTYSFGAGGADVFIAKLTDTNTLSWVKVLGGTANESGYSIREARDGGIFITGDTGSFGSGNLFLAKLSSTGALDWMTTVGSSTGGGNHGRSIQETADGSIFVAAYTSSFGAGDQDLFLLKFNDIGGLDWARTLGGINSDVGTSVLDSGDGGILVSGHTASFGVSSINLLLAKFTDTGILSWAKRLEAAHSAPNDGLIKTLDDGILMTGYTSLYGAGASDVLLVKFNDTGDLTWAKTLGSVNSDVGRCIQQSITGDILLGGYTNGFGVSNNDLLLARLDSDGDIPNCAALQSIAPNVVSITPTVMSINPIVQSVTPIIQDWNIPLVSNTPTERTHCFSMGTTGIFSTSGTTGSTTNAATSASVSTGASPTSSTTEVLTTASPTTGNLLTSTTGGLTTSGLITTGMITTSTEDPLQDSNSQDKNNDWTVIGIVFFCIGGVMVLSGSVYFGHELNCFRCFCKTKLDTQASEMSSTADPNNNNNTDDIKVFVWLPKYSCVSPTNTGSYGHAAIELPGYQDSDDTIYVSLYKNNQFHNKKCDKKLIKSYDKKIITIPIGKNALQKMHSFLDEKYPGRMMTAFDNDGKRYQTPKLGTTKTPFSYLVPACYSSVNNCTSIVIRLLQKGGIDLPFGRWHSTATFIANFISAVETGYSIGVLSDLCNKCKDDKTAEVFSTSQLIGMGAFLTVSIILYAISLCKATGIPRLPKCHKSFNPFLMISYLFLTINTLLTGASTYFHFKAQGIKALDKELIPVGVVAAVGVVLLFLDVALVSFMDSFNYLVRPVALKNALWKKNYRIDDSDSVVESSTHSDDTHSDSVQDDGLDGTVMNV